MLHRFSLGTGVVVSAIDLLDLFRDTISIYRLLFSHSPAKWSLIIITFVILLFNCKAFCGASDEFPFDLSGGAQIHAASADEVFNACSCRLEQVTELLTQEDRLLCTSLGCVVFNVNEQMLACQCSKIVEAAVKPQLMEHRTAFSLI